MRTPQTDKKVELIQDILNIIVGRPIDLIEFKGIQEVTFVKEENSRHIFRVMRLTWNDYLDFIIFRRSGNKWEQISIPTSRWFKVRDLLRKNFLQAEKLKSK